MNNDEKVKEMLEKEPVPKELEPENIKAMLDEKSADKEAEKKRSGISVAGRLAAAAAACAVIGGGSYAYLSGTKPSRSQESVSSIVEEVTVPEAEQTTELFSQQAYMSGATDYSQIYELMKISYENQKKLYKTYTTGAKGVDMTDDAVEEAVAEEAEEAYGTNSDDMFKGQEQRQAAAAASVESSEEESAAEEYNDEEYVFTEDNAGDGNINDIGGMGGAEEEQTEYSDTHNQEENVLEADIAKTDGKYIYYITNADNGENSTVLRSAKVKDGKFLSSHTTHVDIQSFYEGSDYSDTFVEDMYLYNDMIVIIGNTFNEWTSDHDYRYKQTTYAAFYTTGDSPELIDVYYQDGGYQDVRIAPDGYMYLVTNYTSDDFTTIEDPDDHEKYIPQCGLAETCALIPPEDILLPPDDDTRAITYVNYSIIGSVDLNDNTAPSNVDVKALTDYSGQLYASENNFYTAAGHGEETDLTRIAIGSGGIAPAASATVEGYVKDQFSMSEYNGYFRVAVTRNSMYRARWWEKLADDANNIPTLQRDNTVYVFDLDMNEVGSIGNFGEDESIKSVNFQGDMAYVVTYEQTDPLFAIDLSDPTAPVILDEFKINGYSTYMQKWSDGLLLGFGVNADENAIETGIKLVMFDNSDPENLKEVGFWSMDRANEYSWVTSQAVWERKALLIAPEKNIIGIPVQTETQSGGSGYGYNWEYHNEYIFLSYENGQFVEKGVIEAENNDFYDDFVPNRAIYIGDYVYVLSGARFISADIDTITVTDDLKFSEGDRTEVPETTETEAVTEEETETPVETTETTAEPTEPATEETTETVTETEIAE